MGGQGTNISKTYKYFLKHKMAKMQYRSLRKKTFMKAHKILLLERPVNFMKETHVSPVSNNLYIKYNKFPS